MFFDWNQKHFGRKNKMEISENYSDKARYDYDLVRRAVDKSDEKAYTEIQGEYKEPIYYMLLKMINNREDAEDLTIETFGKAFKNLPAFRPDFAFLALGCFALPQMQELTICVRND